MGSASGDAAEEKYFEHEKQRESLGHDYRLANAYGFTGRAYRLRGELDEAGPNPPRRRAGGSTQQPTAPN